MKFNINDYVAVRLTDRGRSIHQKYWAKFGAGFDPPEKEDPDGTTKFQLWELMHVFGSHIHNGCEVPFETEIEFLIVSKP